MGCRTADWHTHKAATTAEMATGADELGMKIAGPTSLLPEQTTTFEFRGPYEGQLVITPDAKTALGSSEAEAVCNGAGQAVNLTKGSGAIALYATNCRDEIGGVGFNVDMPDECRRQASPPGHTDFEYTSAEEPVPTTEQTTPQQTVPECVRDSTNPSNNQQGQNTGNGNSDNSGGNGGGNKPGGHEYYIGGGGYHVGAGETATEPTGSEEISLEVDYLMLDEVGPYHVLAWWPTVQGAQHFRVVVEAQGTPRAGAGTLPAAGWKVPYGASYAGRMHSIVFGGEGTGLWPGGTYQVRVQAIGPNGDYGPMSEAKTVTTYHATELGAVTNIRASERQGGQAGFVTINWDRSPGQDSSLRDRQDSVVVQYKKAGESYIASRTARVDRHGGGLRTPLKAFTPRLEQSTEYCFRITPKRVNMPDGEPAELCYTTRELQPPPKPTIENIERSGGWLAINFKTNVVFDSVKVLLTAEGNTMTRTIEEEGYAYSSYIRIGAIPTNRSYCIQLTGFVGDGASKLEGEPSDEVCE